MPSQKDNEAKTAAEALGDMLKTFGNTMSEILDDPNVKESARQLASSVVDSAAKVVESKIKAEELRRKFRNVGKAAQTIGNSVESHFQSQTE
jgi:[ribosomal protein S5]-alanine N-acetyltransferase